MPNSKSKKQQFNKKRKKPIKNNDKRLIISAVALTCLLILTIGIAIKDGIENNTCKSDQECTNEFQTQCTVNKNGHEECKGGSLSFSYSTGKNGFSINYTTAHSLGIIKDNSIDTGSKYLYVSPDTHQYTLVEKTTIERLQSENEICLTTKDALANISKYKCVAFYVRQIHSENNTIFLSEETEYRNGFNAIIMTNFVDYETLKNEYLGRYVAVSGIIEIHEGYPQIKVWGSGKLSNNLIFVGYNNNAGLLYKL